VGNGRTTKRHKGDTKDTNREWGSSTTRTNGSDGTDVSGRNRTEGGIEDGSVICHESSVDRSEFSPLEKMCPEY
jgi:hypothetical protein